MFQIDNSFINLIFLGMIALFPVINPIGSAFMVSPYLAHLCPADKRVAVQKITIYAFFICIISLFAGQYILRLFGISMPIVQLGGGIMICKMGWEFLSTDDKKDTAEGVEKPVVVPFKSIANRLFYPITFPITTGAGTISVLFTLGAHVTVFGSREYYMNMLSIILAITAMCVLVYIFYLNTEKLIHYLGENGEMVVNRISAFLIFCVGLKIGFSGLTAILHL
ncbi:MarC family protein [Mucilaginibacter gynuensis]